MKKFTLLLFIILIGSLSIFAQSSRAKKKSSKATTYQAKKKTTTLEREKFDQTANPGSDLQKAITKARKQNKRIILDVGGEWCGWCHRMDDFILRNAALKKSIDENFIWLKINFSEENENKTFLSNYPAITGYPHLFVLEKDGTFLYSKETSALEDGGKSYNLQRFTDFLNEYAPAKTVSK